MKHQQFAKKPVLLIVLISICFFQSKAGNGNPGGGHPYYLHALSDLRAARWMIEHHPDDWDKTVDEVEAVKQIDAAIKEIKSASIEDGKDISDHPPVDEHPDHTGRLQEAIEFLKKARQDISHDEDNQFAHGLQARTYNHIDAAIQATKQAIHD